MSADPKSLESKRVEASYLNSSQQCMAACVDALSRSLLIPQTLADLVAALQPDYNRDTVFRTLWNLEKCGWVVKLGGGYLLSPDLTKLSDRLRLQLIEVGRAYLENPHA